MTSRRLELQACAVAAFVELAPRGVCSKDEVLDFLHAGLGAYPEDREYVVELAVARGLIRRLVRRVRVEAA